MRAVACTGVGYACRRRGGGARPSPAKPVPCSSAQEVPLLLLPPTTIKITITIAITPNKAFSVCCCLDVPDSSETLTRPCPPPRNCPARARVPRAGGSNFLVCYTHLVESVFVLNEHTGHASYNTFSNCSPSERQRFSLAGPRYADKRRTSKSMPCYPPSLSPSAQVARPVMPLWRSACASARQLTLGRAGSL